MSTFIVLHCGTVQVTGSMLEIAVAHDSVPVCLVSSQNVSASDALDILERKLENPKLDITKRKLFTTATAELRVIVTDEIKSWMK